MNLKDHVILGKYVVSFLCNLRYFWVFFQHYTLYALHIGANYDSFKSLHIEKGNINKCGLMGTPELSTLVWI